MEDRAITLLKAARDLLIKQKEAGVLINCPVQVSEEFDDLKTTKGDKPVTLRYITSLKP